MAAKIKASFVEIHLKKKVLSKERNLAAFYGSTSTHRSPYPPYNCTLQHRSGKDTMGHCVHGGGGGVAKGGGSRRNSFKRGNSFTLGEIVLRHCFRQNFKFGKFKN